MFLLLFSTDNNKMANNQLQNFNYEKLSIITVLTLHNTRHGSIVLELVEGFLQHVLWVDLLHTQ